MKNFCCEIGKTRRHLVAAIILDGKRILGVREKETDVWIIPGGGHEAGETHEQTLKRELQEELSVVLKQTEFFGQVIEPAIWEEGEVAADIYFVEIEGEPRPNTEIEEVRWFEGRLSSQGEIGSILEKRVIPQLIARGIL